jgi:uncharacterized protein YhaN
VKILELQLTSFGPFTDRSIDLSEGNHGLHVIFGRNEAGKSSALRALEALLFGIAAQTADDFIHPYQKLRVGARLRLSSGEELQFSRKKSPKGSLLGPGDSKLGDDVLDRFLCGVTKEQFRQFWGIDYWRLVEGGKSLLLGQGELAESLFAAGTGLLGVRGLTAQLESEANKLFVPKGQKGSINQALATLKELQKEQRDATVSVEEWQRRLLAVSQAEQEIASITALVNESSKQRTKLERVKRVLPLFAEREEVRKRLSSLAAVKLLALDFPERRQAVLTTTREAQQNHARATAELAEVGAVVERLGETPALVAESFAVNELHKSLGVHRKAMSDRPRIVGDFSTQRDKAQKLLHEIRPDLSLNEAEPLRSQLGRRPDIQKLVGAKERLEERANAAAGQVAINRKTASELDLERASLPLAAANLELLSATISEAKRKGDVDGEQDKLAKNSSRLRAQCQTVIAKLQLPLEGLQSLGTLPIAAKDVIIDFQKRQTEIEEADRADERERAMLAKDLADLNDRIESFARTEDLPNEEALQSSRAQRDRAFELLVQRWEYQKNVEADAAVLLGEGKLTDLYPVTVKAADNVADRLRSEADRVAEISQCLSQRKSHLARIEANGAAVERRKALASAMQAQWEALWKPLRIPVPKIAAAREWREDFDRLLVRADELAVAEQDEKSLSSWIAAQMNSLDAALVANGASQAVNTLCTFGLKLTLAVQLHERLERDAKALAEHQRRTSELAKAELAAQSAINEVKIDLQKWQTTWLEVSAGLGNGGTVGPADAMMILDRLEAMFPLLDDAGKSESRINGIDRDAEIFRTNVRSLAQRLGESVSAIEGSEDTWLESTQKTLQNVQRENEERRLSIDSLNKWKLEVESAKTALAIAKAEAAALAQEAGCDESADLLEVEQRSTSTRNGQRELERIEKDLVRLGDGNSLEELQSQAGSVEGDSIEASVASLAFQLAELEARLAQLRDTKATAQAELRNLQGSSVAGDKAQELQSTLAGLRNDVLRHARLTAASTLLSRRIDEYRRQNQTPLLLRASELFAQITQGAFCRLETDVDDNNKPMLFGIRSNSDRVASEAMSEGTRDQVFLCLRLAAVQASCDAGEPLPFIVDDVLVQFDDERSAAALCVLAEVAKKTQVILFTHHERVKSCAEQLSGDAGVFVHSLSSFT